MTGASKLGDVSYESTLEQEVRLQMEALYKNCPIPDDEIMKNLGLFINSKNLARLLFFNHIYQQIIEVPGVVCEFGTRWGQNLTMLAALRGLYEPFNRHRKLVGFDTFEGFPQVDAKDGNSALMKAGMLSTTACYHEYLEALIKCHELCNPLSHIKKFEIVKGNAIIECPQYIARHPETIIAFAYFDFDIYEPTKKCLEIIRPRLVKGSVVGFDELNDPDSPGETLALMEVIGLPNIRLRRFPITSRVSYFVVE